MLGPAAAAHIPAEARGETMATIYAPKISAEDFPAFQNMTGLDLPATYEEWLQRQEH
jgi:hypothetical protein